MPELFELTELVSYMQVPELQADIAMLARRMTTIEIRNHVGGPRYDAMADVSVFFAIALKLAKRCIFNAEGLRSEKIDDYERTISAEDLLPPELTEAEQEQIDTILQRLAGRARAFSIVPGAPRSCRPAWR